MTQTSLVEIMDEILFDRASNGFVNLILQIKPEDDGTCNELCCSLAMQ
jgi:hypothetical protein